MRLKSSFVAGQALLGMLMLALLALVGRLVYIDTQDAPRLLARVHDQQRATIPLPARRGLIVDSRGRIIAGTALQYSVFADPALVQDKEAAAREIGRILAQPAQELGQDLIAAADRRFFVLRRGISEAQARAVRAAGIRGVGTFEEPYRTYPLGSLAAQVLGFVSRDGAGLGGVELHCDAWLRGEAGVKTIVRDAARRAFWLAEDGYQAPRDGYHVVLTIDSVIQSAAEKAVRAAVEKYEATSGVAVVMDPSDGAVLAMANWPTFDPNHYQDYAAGSSWRFRNRAVTDPYEPGSIFKPFIAAWALSEKVTRLDEVINCESGVWRDGARLLHDHHAYSNLSFIDVVAKSSNIGMAKLGKRLGNNRLQQCLKAFGFGTASGIEFPGEEAGLVRPPHAWNSFTTTSVPMGQEVGVTPLQMARAFCVFVNGGRLVKPRLVRAVLATDGSVVEENRPSEGPRVLDEETVAAMRDVVLSAVVNVGTGTNAALAHYQVLGKTGTAQIAKRGGGGYVPDAYVSSMVAAAPQQDTRLVVLVSVTQPKKSLGYYGGTVAAPAVRSILADSLAYLQVPAELHPTGAVASQ